MLFENVKQIKLMVNENADNSRLSDRVLSGLDCNLKYKLSIVLDTDKKIEATIIKLKI